MTDTYEDDERISIKIDSGISEMEATRQVYAEKKPVPESILKLQVLKERVQMDNASKALKRSRKYNYD